MLQIRLSKKLPFAVGALHHGIVSVIAIGMLIKLLDLLYCPVIFCVYHLELIFWKLGCLLSLAFWLFALLQFELLHALRIMNLQARQSEISSTNAASKCSRLFVIVSGESIWWVFRFGIRVASFTATLLVGFQRLFIECPTTVFAGGQRLIFMNIDSLLIVTNSFNMYISIRSSSY